MKNTNIAGNFDYEKLLSDLLKIKEKAEKKFIQNALDALKDIFFVFFFPFFLFCFRSFKYCSMSFVILYTISSLDFSISFLVSCFVFY